MLGATRAGPREEVFEYLLPRLNQLLMHVEEKGVQKFVKNNFESTFVTFFAQVKIEVTIGHESRKSMFRGYGTCLQINVILLETQIPKLIYKNTG